MKQLICSTCGTIGTIKKSNKGSLILEFGLWMMAIIFLFLPFLFLIPISYSIWRLCARIAICRNCKNENSMIPLSSPIGQKIKKELHNVDDNNSVGAV